jgi:hypothetical protein
MAKPKSNFDKLGWKKDKYDKRDYLHKVSAKKIPASFILPNVPTIRDQGMVGSCVGFGLGANLTGLAMEKDVYTEWFSPNWIYNGARFIEGSLMQDAGAYPKDGLDWLRSKGCLLDHFWPYNPNILDTTSPPSEYNDEAAKYPLITYYRVTGGAAGICDAIASGYYVSIGTPWYNKWMNPPASGLLPAVRRGDGIAGGHETCLYGYDQTKSLFYGINSWGTGWANKGLYLMPFQAFNIFRYAGGYDAHYIDVNWQAVVPTPEPVPVPEPADIVKVQVRKCVNDGDWEVLYEGEVS